MEIKIDVTKDSIEFARRMIDQYTNKAAYFEAKAEAADKPQLRGNYLYHSKRRRKDIERWRATLAMQMEWLAEHNPELWLELRGNQ